MSETPAYDSLPTQRQRFVDELIVDYDVVRAYRAAGYAAKHDGVARAGGYRLKKVPEVEAAIRERQAQIRKRLEWDQDRVVLETARLALSDVRQLFDGEGRLKDIHALDDHTAAAVASVKVVSRPSAEKGPDGETTVDHVHEIKMWDKGAAIEKLMKHTGAYAEDNAQKSGVFANVPRDKLKAVLAALRDGDDDA